MKRKDSENFIIVCNSNKNTQGCETFTIIMKMTKEIDWIHSNYLGKSKFSEILGTDRANAIIKKIKTNEKKPN